MMEAIVALITLTALEIVLGIDNIVPRHARSSPSGLR